MNSVVNLEEKQEGSQLMRNENNQDQKHKIKTPLIHNNQEKFKVNIQLNLIDKWNLKA